MNPSKADEALSNRTAFPRFFCLIFTVSFLFLLLPAVLSGTGIPAAGAAEIKMNCNIHEGPCLLSRSGLEITLDISPKPVRAMQDLTFRVTLTGKAPDRTLLIDLGMPGMKMGPNRVILKKTTGTVYEGKGVIVRCPSGSRIWQATVTVPAKGKAGFIFDVVY